VDFEGVVGRGSSGERLGGEGAGRQTGAVHRPSAAVVDGRGGEVGAGVGRCMDAEVPHPNCIAYNFDSALFADAGCSRGLERAADFGSVAPKMRGKHCRSSS